MKLKDDPRFPKKKKGINWNSGKVSPTDMRKIAFNQALDIVGELEVLERLDVEKVEKTIIEQCVYCKFWDGKGHKLAQAICNKFGAVKKEG